MIPRQVQLQPISQATLRHGLLWLGFAVSAHAAAFEVKDEDSQNGLPGMEMLVEGSILQKVMFPQYDEQLRLGSVLRADKLTLVADGIIDAETVRIEFFNPDDSPKASIDLESARLEEQKILRTSEAVAIDSEDLSATGTGLVYDLQNRRGFLYGPATATTLIDQSTSMKEKPRLRSAVAGAALMATAASAADGLDKLTPGEAAALDKLASSQAEQHANATKDADQVLDAAKSDSEAADAALGSFLEEAAAKVDQGKPVDLTSKVADPAEPPSFKLPAELTCDEGFYFDMAAGALIFIKNVKVVHPDFTLTGADEVKVFFEEKPAKKVATDKEERDGSLLGKASFGKPSKIVAVGPLVVEHKKDPNDPDDQNVKASGRQMVYDLKGEELIIRGGEPWIISDSIRGRIIDPKGYFRINRRTGKASANGTLKAFAETAE